ncbi:NADH-quinone oxidoreductase subunit NuoE [Pelagibacterium halotolerans]|uniref:NADH-ubiquinone oxidoreductase chain E n=1 Tax=Pelagibacterium halotolerans (strain DSM 22347 / JCM 15775 / CGMCC 1.7692 / B2) TaxID=1082931 RepID=G4R863_PELHB|nr:NADH-quinone oxidoreductase subunit NuoE [Pelagibacterium halotolerans]AEQ51341.1 NADH-ubiquinone oxidoreductase chain E [Pelagibacterium halotolerans B2]QJR18812.1 NADH-quinone oxidoreductase subunit NuoE [Pelagibacterium halotolerans]SEA93398.1 NADH dehydrogenase subunit E [Pelagibacterium halotolerans]
MSVRRLAEETVQPASFSFSKENTAWARKRIAMYPAGRQQSAVIPLLMRAQEQDGWVSRATIESVAQMLDMPYIRVLEVATFYTQFQLQPVGSRAHIQVCGTTPCMLRGAEDIRAVCQKHIHAEPHHLNDDGTMSWEEVECAGACVNAPMVTIGFDTYEDLTPERFEEILIAFRDGKGDTVPTGPQNGRKFSAPLDGQVTLLEDPTKAPPHQDAGRVEGKAKATKPGRKQEIDEEAAPAIKGPSGSGKVSEAEAVSAEKKAAGPAKRKPGQAGREGATGAESPAVEKTGSETGQKTKTTSRSPGKQQEAVATSAGTTPDSAPLFTPPEGTADDLKLISGVGPVIERKLNDLGIKQYAQVAAFTDAEVDQVDAVLNFKGRIARDNWKGQAKALADGGVDEYVRVFGKKPR